MLLILGPERKPKGAEDWSVRDLHHPCAVCWLETAEEPRVYWPAALWPEAQKIVDFDAERQRLGLPSLENSYFH